jgi:hypothetical protein
MKTYTLHKNQTSFIKNDTVNGTVTMNSSLFAEMNIERNNLKEELAKVRHLLEIEQDSNERCFDGFRKIRKNCQVVLDKNLDTISKLRLHNHELTHQVVDLKIKAEAQQMRADRLERVVTDLQDNLESFINQSFDEGDF